MTGLRDRRIVPWNEHVAFGAFRAEAFGWRVFEGLLVELRGNAVLTKVKIANYRCLKSVNVPLGPLTVLVGPNDSGKSVFLKALEHLSSMTRFQDADHWRLDPDAAPSVTGAVAGDLFSISEKGGSWDQSIWPQLPFAPCGMYHLPSQGVAMNSPGYPEAGGLPTIDQSGSGVPALVDYLLRRDRKRFDHFVAVLRGLVPGLEDIDIATPDPAQRRIDLVIEKGLRIPADQASAGLRLLLFFVALTFHPTPPKLILLEEPETGVHPQRLGDVMKLLRQLTEGKHGGRVAQVVLTTHSPYLLDRVELAQDTVLVFSRNDDGSRTAEPASPERLKHFLGEFLLGEVWFNEGEAGLIASRPQG